MPANVLYFLIGLNALTGLVLVAWRGSDHRADRVAMQRLLAAQPAKPGVFHPDMIAELPEPARRYFLYTIETGTPLNTVARITMTGRFGLGTRANATYLPMAATQILAMPTGFVWKMHARRGFMRLSGSDSESWTRFWLMGVLPVARTGGDPDHARSAFGRCAAEAVFWTPAAVLPGRGIHWQPLDKDVARLVVSHGNFSQAVDVTVAADGRPTQVRFERWSNANPQKQYRRQPFGGCLSEYREFAGFHLPTHVEAGNGFGTDQYFPFFEANVTDIDFPHD
jgi:hypothetical protein